jgi:hypothetical protein
MASPDANASIVEQAARVPVAWLQMASSITAELDLGWNHNRRTTALRLEAAGVSSTTNKFASGEAIRVHLR